MPRERVARIGVARPVVAVAFGPPQVVSGVAVALIVKRVASIVSLGVAADGI